MTNRFDAIVVGGGHNGLVAAHYLARSGLSVQVVERRHVVGGPCAPWEFFPGYRGAISNSPGSLEPKIARDMELERFGLIYDKPDPAMVHPFPDGRAFIGWRDRSRIEAELRKFSKRDVTAYHEIFEFFNRFGKTLGISLFAPPPSLKEMAARLKTPEDEAAFATIMFGNTRDFLDDRLESDEIKALIAVMCMFGGNYGPSSPGSLLALLQRPMSLSSMTAEAGHDPRVQPLRGSTGLPRGGMGSVVEAMARSITASGVAIRTEATVVKVKVGAGDRAEGVVLADGEEIDAPLVLSNLNPKTTLLDLIDARHLDEDLRTRLDRRRMRGCAFKAVLALGDMPRFSAAPADGVKAFAACQFRIAPSMDHLERGYEDAKNGRPSRDPRIMGLTPSVMDPNLAPPGKHLMSLNCWHAPYHLEDGDWATEKDRFGQRIIDTVAEYVPNLKDIIEDTFFLSPKDLEDEFGLVEGHQLHGDMTPAAMFSNRPVPGLADYRTPVGGLYLCGSGTWPGGFVSGIPGHNGSHQALKDHARDAVLSIA
jgi:phytoene dehydrogenase-like protein